MGRACAGFMVAVTLGAASPRLAAEAPPVIEHQPLRCVVARSYPWIQARAAGAVAVRARFRRLGSHDWYVVRLSDEADGWTGALPRPGTSLAAFAYLLEATDAAAGTTRTPEHTVRVVPGEGACGTDGVGPSVPEAMVTAEGPRGRPALPKGFEAGEPEAQGAKVGVLDISPRTAVVAALGVGAAAAGAALVLTDKPEAVNRVELLGSTPASGATISYGSLALSIRVRVTSASDLGAGGVLIDVGPIGRAGGCVVMYAPHQGLTAGRALEVTVDRVVFVDCVPPFTATHVTAVVNGPNIVDTFGNPLPLSYSFVP
jgi:hypothetical protein